MEYSDLLQLLQTRRSIRAFTSDPVPDNLVDKIIEAARWAPSGANSQPWEFVVITEAETKARIADIVHDTMGLAHEMELTRPEELRWPSAARPVPDQLPFKNAPVLILACGDHRVSKSFPLVAYLERGEANLISAMSNAFLCMTLAATSLGLGCHYVSQVGAPYPSAMIKNLLGLPEDYFIYDMLSLGYPAMEPKPRLVRAREDMTHRERYEPTKHRDDEQIREWLVSLRR